MDKWVLLFPFFPHKTFLLPSVQYYFKLANGISDDIYVREKPPKLGKSSCRKSSFFSICFSFLFLIIWYFKHLIKIDMLFYLLKLYPLLNGSNAFLNEFFILIVSLHFYLKILFDLILFYRILSSYLSSILNWYEFFFFEKKNICMEYVIMKENVVTVNSICLNSNVTYVNIWDVSNNLSFDVVMVLNVILYFFLLHVNFNSPYIWWFRYVKIWFVYLWCMLVARFHLY